MGISSKYTQLSNGIGIVPYGKTESLDRKRLRFSKQPVEESTRQFACQLRWSIANDWFRQEDRDANIRVLTGARSLLLMGCSHFFISGRATKNRTDHSGGYVMRWTRLSFLYLIGYLTVGGVGLIVVPEFSVRLFGGTGSYPIVLWRVLGGFMLGIAIIIFQIVRLRVEVLYTTPLMVRVPILAVMLWAYFDTRDLVFLTLAVIVAIGMILTTIGLVVDGRTRSTAQAHSRS